MAHHELHSSRDELIARIKELEAWIEGDAFCPCCEGERECSDGCTFFIDCPSDSEHMNAVREILYGGIK